jgi:hypothetical protein
MADPENYRIEFLPPCFIHIILPIPYERIYVYPKIAVRALHVFPFFTNFREVPYFLRLPYEQQVRIVMLTYIQ